MSADQPRAVFVQFTAQPSGSPISGLMVVDALRETGYEVHTVFGRSGELAEEYRPRCATLRQIEHGQWLGGGPWHRRFRRLLRDYRAAGQFAELFRELRPKLVYVNNLTGLAPALAARRLGIPCVWHIRELFDDVGGEMRPPWPGGRRHAVHYLGRCADRLVVISQAVQENVLNGRFAEKVTLLPNAVDDRFFDESRTRAEARSALGLPAEGSIVGVPGTLRPVKGHAFFLEAASAVHRRQGDVVFAVTGNGESRYRRELETQTSRLGLTPHVRFLGNVSDMPGFYRACDVICVPSRSESFGRTAVEAMAVGTPVVATAVGGLQETIEPGKTGLLVPFGDVERLADSLLGLLEDGDTRRQMAEQGREQAEREYRADRYEARISEVLDLFPVSRGRQVARMVQSK